MTTRDQGSIHENTAARYLQQKGLTLLETNHHCRFGEIDLIMRDDATIVFIEVRFRRSSSYGGAAISVTPKKQRKIILTAKHYLQRHGKCDYPCRFDVFAITGRQGDSEQLWIRNAFDASV